MSVGGVLELEKISVANTYCPKDGSVSRTATGAPLSCQSGIWKTQGSKGGQYVLRKFWPSGVVVPSNHVACQSNPVTG
ncbi:shufflon system plasmid conjugative transfer pilus tip adhesin PilV, partial [Citrobacter portucalensis]